MILGATAVLLFFTSFAVAAVLLPVIERTARARGIVDRPGGRKDHDAPTPYGGGIAIFSAVAFPVGGGLLVALATKAWPGAIPDAVARHAPGLLAQAPPVLAILAGAALVLGVGWIDDRRGLSPAIRLAAQIAAASLLVASGVKATLHVESPAAHAFVTIVFVVFVTNATNFIDNMNGLLAGVGAVATACFLAIAAATGQWFVAAMLICLLGGLLAFLPRNFPRASIFLGDAGSMTVGFLLSAMTIACDFDAGAVTARPIVLPLLILFVPIADGVVVVVARVLAGKSPFEAGRDHLSHRLVDQGFTREHAVVYFWGLALLCGAIALVYAKTPLPVVGLAVGPPVVCLGWVARKLPG